MVNFIAKATKFSDMPNYDYHSHSFYSDGVLSPEALIDRAIVKGVEYLALTDHDSLTGLEVASEYIRKNSIDLSLINGVEISAGTEYGEIHIVGLGIYPENKALESQLHLQRQARWERAERIDAKLKKCRVDGVLEHLKSEVHQVVTRTHIARSIKALGYVNDLQQAFKKYIGKGGRAKVAQQWIPMEHSIALIKEAGGIAVLAHPTRYPLSNRKLALLIESFAQNGGEGIEMSYPSINKDKADWLEIHRSKNNLLASGGSDFHYPDLKWSDLGRFPEISRETPHVSNKLKKSA